MNSTRATRFTPSVFGNCGRRLTREDERILFGRLRLLRDRANEARRLSVVDSRSSDVCRERRLRCLATRVRNRILRANLPLVCSVAKGFVTTARSLQELVSDGVVSMMRAIDKFDEHRGFKFSTYATVAITRSFIRDKGNDLRQRARFRSSCDEAIATAQTRSEDDRAEAETSTLGDAVRGVLNQLDKRDRSVISLRFGLCSRQRASTLEEVGNRLGISKERARQIEVRAMARVRTFATAANLDEYLD